LVGDGEGPRKEAMLCPWIWLFTCLEENRSKDEISCDETVLEHYRLYIKSMDVNKNEWAACDFFNK
jgi:hypothetical protein